MAIAKKPRPRSQDRKRQASHHRRNKTYLKAYWPYIPMVAVVVLGVVLNGILTGHNSVLGTSTDLDRSGLLETTNIDRTANHVGDLRFNSELNQAAQNKADDMVKNNYWAHNSPSGKTPWTFILASGYEFQQAGENLAYGFDTSASVVQAWMNSPEHRANMLNSNFQEVGFGIAESPAYIGHGPEIIVVAEYGEPLVSVAGSISQPPKAVVTPKLQNVSRISLLAGNDASASEIIISILIGAAGATLIIRHGLYLRRLVMEGEGFIIDHPFLDISVVCICTAGILLLKTAGRIG
ncbi:MAG TPA: CAP domain-containing protein [Candidatus Saccharimonadales bacterium]|nr:CAP domain-containing protein [Candidatus Saccharimonadales bacterium]